MQKMNFTKRYLNSIQLKTYHNSYNQIYRNLSSSPIHIDMNSSCSCLSCHSITVSQMKSLKTPTINSKLIRSRKTEIITNSKRNFAFSSKDSDDEPHIEQLLDNNRKWVKQSSENDPQFFDKLARTQTPKYLYFGCSDSRVPANQIIGLG